MAINLYDYVASIPDYPEKGIVFRDILPLMANGEAFKQATDEIANYARDKHVDMVVGPRPGASLLVARLLTNSGSALPRPVRRGNCPGRQSLRLTTWNTGRQPCKWKMIPSSRANGC